MGPNRSVTASLRWVCCLLLLPQAAPAAISRYRLQVVRADGAASCPSGAELERDVVERLRRNPFAETGERGLEVVVQRVEGRWQARLYLRVDASEVDSVRLIESEETECAELGRAVALAVALAIAPDLPPEPKPIPVAPPPAPCPPPPPPPPLPKRTSLHGTASLRAVLSPNLLPIASGGGAARTLSPGGAVALTFRGDLFGATVGGLFFPTRELHSPDAKLGFGLTAGFASGCLWARLENPQIWSCIGARAGALHSVVYSPDPVQPGDRFWWAASSELGLRLSLFGRAFAEGGVAAIFPLVRHRFKVDAPLSPSYEQGPALVEGFLGVGLRLD